MVVVSDTSVLIDLQRGALLPSAFRAPWEFAVPDLLYEREMKPLDIGDELRNLGLRVEALDGDGVALAIGYQRCRPELSLPDSFALALAKTNAWMLLTGDRALRTLAEGESVDCHGVLWLLVRMLETGRSEPGRVARWSADHRQSSPLSAAESRGSQVSRGLGGLIGAVRDGAPGGRGPVRRRRRRGHSAAGRSGGRNQTVPSAVAASTRACRSRTRVAS